MAERLIDEDYPLKHFVRALEKFRPPEDAFDAGGAWKSAYEIIECAGLGGNSGRAWRIGTLALEREPAGRGRARLRLDYHKRAAGGSLHLSGELVCRTDTLSTPLSWKLETESLDPSGEPIEDLRLAESGSAGKDGLKVRLAGRERRVRVPPPFTMHWCLLDAVQRLPGDKTPEQRFTLLDRLDWQVKPGQRLAFRETAEVLFGSTVVWGEEKEPLEVGTRYRPVPRREGGAKVQVRVYEQFGEGILPITYWVDGRGRLLFLLSGLMAYVYNPEATLPVPGVGGGR